MPYDKIVTIGIKWIKMGNTSNELIQKCDKQLLLALCLGI